MTALRQEFDALKRTMQRRPLTAAETRRYLALAQVVGGALL